MALNLQEQLLPNDPALHGILEKSKNEWLTGQELVYLYEQRLLDATLGLDPPRLPISTRNPAKKEDGIYFYERAYYHDRKNEWLGKALTVNLNLDVDGFATTAARASYQEGTLVKHVYRKDDPFGELAIVHYKWTHDDNDGSDDDDSTEEYIPQYIAHKPRLTKNVPVRAFSMKLLIRRRLRLRQRAHWRV